jgi:hypothetical protein
VPLTACVAAAGAAEAVEEAVVAVSGVGVVVRLLLPSLLSAAAKKVRLQVRCVPLPGIWWVGAEGGGDRPRSQDSTV